MTVYVITKGCYSDYHICAVTESFDKAKQLQKRFSDSYDEASIEIFDTESTDEMLRYRKIYSCRGYFDKPYIKVEEVSYDYKDEDDFKVKDYSQNKWWECDLYVIVYADNEFDAVKFASDKFAKFKAEKLGL